MRSVSPVWIVVLSAVAGCHPDIGVSPAGPTVEGEANPPPLESPVVVDRFQQAVQGKTDVLWVVDNSCSMGDDQDELAYNFPVFMEHFLDTDTDWHIGIVHTDMTNPNDAGVLRSAYGYNYITPETPDPLGVLVAMVPNDSGWPPESGRASAYTALEILGDTVNDGFYREDARLSVVVISADRDRSGSTPIDLQGFIDWLSNLKDDPEDVRFSGIVCLNPQGFACIKGDGYIETAEALGGSLHEIQDADWSAVLDQIALDAQPVMREFHLSDYPKADTLDVWVDEPDGQTYTFVQDVDYEWRPTRNSIKFHAYSAPQDSEVVVAYVPLSQAHIDTGTAPD